MSDDPLRDPRFPNRPQHPDFWRLASVATKHDGKVVEGHETTDQVIAAYLDPESLLYMATQRATGYAQKVGAPPAAVVMFAGAILDGVLIGIAFEREGGHRDV